MIATSSTPKPSPRSIAYAALIGIDWADKKHDLWILDTASGQSHYEVLDQTPEAVDAWIANLEHRYAGKSVAIALEKSRSALIATLMMRPTFTLYPINPASLAKYRQTFCPSGAKDDPSDAQLLGDLLIRHPDRFTAWHPDDESTRTLALLNEARRKAVDLRTRLSLRLTTTLKAYYPQALKLVGSEITSAMACDFLLKWPTLAALKKAQSQTLRPFYYGHNCRSSKAIDSALLIATQAPPSRIDPAVITASVVTVKMLARQIRDLGSAIAEYDRHIAQLFDPHPDAHTFNSLPGAGACLAPRLLAAFGTDRERYPQAGDLQTFSGIAPVSVKSGQSHWVHWRWFSPKFIRQTFHEFAKSSLPHCPWAAAYYQLQIERGKGSQAALRALAFKWIRIIHRCWREHCDYDEQRYLDSLKKHGSPIILKLTATTP